MELCRSDSTELRNKNDLFCKVKICVKYPMFLLNYFHTAAKNLLTPYSDNQQIVVYYISRSIHKVCPLFVL